MSQSLCETCLHVRAIISGTGSRFLLCQLSQTDRRFRKYPHFTDWMSSSFFFRDRALIANSRFNALPLVVGSS